MWHGPVFIYIIESKYKLLPKNEMRMCNVLLCNEIKRETEIQVRTRV